MEITITLKCNNVSEAHDAMSKLAATVSQRLTISHDDRPDVGAPTEYPPIVTSDDLPPAAGQFNPFAVPQGSAAAPVVPTQPAPSIAAAVPSSTAPAVPMASSTAPIVAAPSAPITAPAVPAPTASVPPASLAAVELDVTGLPWDNRIHSDSGKGKPKPKNADGTWRQRRGLNDLAMKARVEGELRAAMAATAPTAPAVPPAPILSAAAMQPGGAAAAVVPTVPPSVATQPTAPVAPPPAAPIGDTFGTLMARLAPRMTTDAAAAAKINATLGLYGLSALAQLAARPDLVPTFGAHVDAELATA